MTPIDDTVTHGCDAAEFEGRLLRAQRLMTEHDLDGLLLTTGPNFRYFTGFDTEFWESPTRPWFLIAPREGAPTAVVPEVGEGAFRRTWVSDIRTWPAPRPADDGVSLLSGVLATVPRRFGRIGAELGRESVVRMPLTDFLRIRDGLPGTEIVDGSPCIWSIRMVKTEAEIARAGHICRIVSDAFAAFPGKLAIGMTEREACRALRTDIIARGADNVPYMPAVAGPAGYSQIIGGASDRVIERGDILIIDTGSRFDGYFSDFDRNFAFGPVDDAARKAHEAVWDATEAGIAAAVPGATTTDLWRAMMDVLQRAGASRNTVGRMGHGLGLQLTEPPSNMPGDETPIVPQMVLTIEPGMEIAPGRMIVHEENIVIRDDGAHLLSARAPREMPVIAD